MNFCRFLLLSSSLFFASLCSSSNHCRVSVVLVGSTGDLARRYLWPAIFHSFMGRDCGLPISHDHASKGCGLLVLGGSRKMVQGTEVWGDLLSAVHCETVACEVCLRKFTNSALRVKISDEEDYGEVAKTLDDTYRRLNCTEVGRVFYLSVPPSAYVSIVQYINAYSRPRKGVWLKVVLEKPFGSDLASARLLSGELEHYLAEEEMYRVDHYLGKPGVQQILPFRSANSAKLQQLWNKAHIDHVEIFMKERLDVKGRSGFFDKYGVIRDVHQNHLTEILVRVLMDTTQPQSFQQRKMSFLATLHPAMLRHSILGQYDGYQSHLALDNVGNPNSSTATHATVVLYSRATKWQGVPFILAAGKQLDERKAFARVVFRNWQFSLTDDEAMSCPVELVFLIQDEEFGRPGILLSSHFAELEHGDWEREIVELHHCSYSFLTPLKRAASNAYLSLVEDILNGKKESFVDTESLLASWVVWDPLLKELQAAQNRPATFLKRYSPQDLTTLDFHIENGKLRSGGAGHESPCADGLRTAPYFGFPVLEGSEEYISSCLAGELYAAASASVARTGVFHMALPGGRSPRLLFSALSLEYAERFPWKRTHIWQTDERCVQLNSTDSNWNQIDELLLSQVSIPYHQLHPMPITLHSGVCVWADEGCGLYERQLRNEIGSLKLDHVVIGVGRDGHTASLFPTSDWLSPSTLNSSQWVWPVSLRATAEVAVKERMSLSYEALLSARAVSVLIMGEGKENIVKGVGGRGHLPILQLLEGARDKAHVTLYIAT